MDQITFRRCIIDADLSAFADTWQSQSPAMVAARAKAQNVAASPPTPSAASLLTVLASATGAKAVVEVGTGSGVTALALVAGMGGGVLTSIDADASSQRMAKDVLSEDNTGETQVRLIAGVPREVLPRLTDAAYDLMVINNADENADEYLVQGRRLLRPAGVLVVTDATGAGATTEPGNRTSTAHVMRALSRQVKEDEDLVSAMLPIGSGLLVAVKGP